MSTLRISAPTQQGSRLSWGSELFQLCSNIVEQPSQPVEFVPVPEVCEASWPAWDAAVIELDRVATSGARQ